MTLRSMMGLVRAGKTKLQGTCYLVTWDIDSLDRTAVNRMQYYLFGRGTRSGGDLNKERRGFVWEEGVRYVGQSAVFVLPSRLAEIRRFLEENEIDYEAEALLVL